MKSSVRNTPEVTICVPTYNRASCLKELLLSISTYAPRFRILVSDNASTDGTAAMVRSFSERYRRIIYYRQATNIGAVANLLESVRLAGSEWVMLLGDDDAIHAPLDALPTSIYSSDVEAILLGRCDGDENLSFLRPWPYLIQSDPGSGEARIFSNPESLLASGLCLGAAFSFISGVMVRREAWLRSLEQLKSGTAQKSFLTSLYPQSWIVLNLLTQDSSVCVVDKPFIMGRHGNDRLCGNNILNHARLDVMEFGMIGEYIGSYRPAALEAMQELIRRHLSRHVFCKLGASLYQRGKYGDECWREFVIAAGKYMTPAQRLIPSLVPSVVLQWAYSVYRKYRKPSWKYQNRQAA